MSLRLAIQRGLGLALAVAGLIWGIFTLPSSEAADDFRSFEAQLLRSETFRPKTLTNRLESPAAKVVSDCDTHSQTALLLVEMRLAEAALRSGAATQFDQHIRSLEARSRRVLGCAPRESFVWFLAFNLEVLHGHLNEQSFNLLATSYETSPNEAWISIRRAIVAVPLVLVAPEPLRQKIFSEFQQLIRNGFEDDAARSYLAASGPVRSLLQARIDQLELPQQKSFSKALQKSHS
jgi:hypothetical protein